MGIELRPEDFSSPEAIAKATARSMADHINTMNRIADLDIAAVYDLGRINVDLLHEFLITTEVS